MADIAGGMLHPVKGVVGVVQDLTPNSPGAGFASPSGGTQANYRPLSLTNGVTIITQRRV